MTRTDSPNVSRLEEKKESPSNRKTWKKVGSATVWPCTIDGCDKQFAREADLKRHQRTTKLHSMPSFACPQCHATFTRTDAQRRHQKSRHNGVVIEGDQASSTSPISPTSSTDAAPPLPPSEGQCTEDRVGSITSSSNPAAGEAVKMYYREELNTFTRPTYSLFPATGRNPGWTAANWKSNDNTQYTQTQSPYYRPSFTRPGPTLPPLSCAHSDSSSNFTDSPRSTPISPTNPHELATYTRVSGASSLPPPEPTHPTPNEVAMTLEAIIKYREADSAAQRSGESSRRPIRYDAASISSDEDDMDRNEGMPLEDLVHQDHLDSPAHRPGSLQDILTEDCEPVFSADLSSRVFESSPLARDS